MVQIPMVRLNAKSIASCLQSTLYIPNRGLGDRGGNIGNRIMEFFSVFSYRRSPMQCLV